MDLERKLLNSIWNWAKKLSIIKGTGHRMAEEYHQGESDCEAEKMKKGNEEA